MFQKSKLMKVVKCEHRTICEIQRLRSDWPSGTPGHFLVGRCPYTPQRSFFFFYNQVLLLLKTIVFLKATCISIFSINLTMACCTLYFLNRNNWTVIMKEGPKSNFNFFFYTLILCEILLDNNVISLIKPG